MATARPFLRRGPSGPLAENVGGMIQIGFDQVVADSVILESADGSGAPVPRDAENPIRVVLQDVVPGNYVLVTWTCTFLTIDLVAPESFEIAAVVTTDGTTAFPGTFQLVTGSGSGVETENTPGTICGQGMFLIPDGVTEIVGELRYIFDVAGDPQPTVQINGIGEGASSLGCRLEMVEISSSAVAPPAYPDPEPTGFSTLVPV